MPVCRIMKENNYTRVSNHYLRDNSLSFKAKGLLTLMLSLPEDWDYPTGHKEVSTLMLKTLRGEIWETYMEWFPATVGIKPGTAGCRYIDGREVNMRADGNLHRMYIQVNTVGHINPDKPKVLDAETIRIMTRDYQLGLWGNDFADLGLK